MENRVIKFRAWSGKTMFDVSQITFNDATWDLSKGRGVSIHAQPHIILMQFTGLHDRNGKEIYEGDVGVLKNGDPFAPVTTVTVIESMGSFGIKPISKESDIFGNKYKGEMLPFFHAYNSKFFEVIGNIYENPELI